MLALQLILIALFVAITISFVRWLLKQIKITSTLSSWPGNKNYHPLLGDLPLLIGRAKSEGIPFHALFLQSLQGLSHLYRKDGLCRIWFAHEPHVMLFSAEAMEPVLNSQTIIDKSYDYDLLHCWLGTGLLTSTGNKWRERRKLITPTFHYRILDDFVPIFAYHSKVFIEKLNLLCQKEWIDIIPLVTLYTLDIICETAMGVKLRAQEEKNCEYADAVTNFADILVKRTIKPWLRSDFIFYRTAEGPKLKKALHVLHDFTSKVVKQRKELLNIDKKILVDEKAEEDTPGRKKRRAFLDMLLQRQVEDNCMNDSDICEEVDTFMFEGHDTTSMGISWALYHLGCHPKIQDKLYEELQEIFGNDKEREVTSQDLKQMKYLECVIKESQRLSPSVPAVSRKASEDINIKNYTVPRGTVIILFLYGLHRDPNAFPNPEVFDPDRFLPQNCLGRHPFSYVPFSAGSRNCIGQKFAMMEMKISICNVIRNFSLESLDPLDKILCIPLLILRVQGEMRMKFTPRR